MKPSGTVHVSEGSLSDMHRHSVRVRVSVKFRNLHNSILDA